MEQNKEVSTLFQMPDGTFELTSNVDVENNPVPENIVNTRIFDFSFNQYDEVVINPGVNHEIDNGTFFNVITIHLNSIWGVNIRNYGVPRNRETNVSLHEVDVSAEV